MEMIVLLLLFAACMQAQKVPPSPRLLRGFFESDGKKRFSSRPANLNDPICGVSSLMIRYGARVEGRKVVQLSFIES